MNNKDDDLEFDKNSQSEHAQDDRNMWNMIRESQKDQGLDLEASFRSNADSALNDRESWAGDSVLR